MAESPGPSQVVEERAVPAVVLVTTCDSAFALPALEALVRLRGSRRVRLVGVVDAARPAYAEPRARARRIALSLVRDRRLPETVAGAARRAGVPIFVPPAHDLNGAASAYFFARSGADYALVFGCDQILRAPLLGSGVRFVNYHNSFLPEYRGVSATAWPLLEGAAETGFTWHTIDDEAIDEGRLVLQRRVPVDAGSTSGALGTLLDRGAAEAIPEVIERLASGAPLAPVPKGGRYYSRKKLDAVLRADLDAPAEELARRARVLGAVRLSAFGIDLRLQQVEVDRGVPLARRALSVRVPARDGAVRVGRVNYLPAVLLAPLVKLAVASARAR